MDDRVKMILKLIYELQRQSSPTPGFGAEREHGRTGKWAHFSLFFSYASRCFEELLWLRDAGRGFQKQRFKTHLAEVLVAQTRLDTTALRPFVDRVKAVHAATP